MAASKKTPRKRAGKPIPATAGKATAARKKSIDDGPPGSSGKGTTAARPTRAGRARRESGELLLAATGSLLARRSTVDVSLSEIAQESGLNSALISYHFGNKEGLLLALIRRDAETSLAQLERLLELDMPPEEKIRSHIRGIISTYAEFPYLNRLMHLLLDSGKPKLAKSIAEFFIEPLVAAQSTIIDEGVAAGVFRKVDPMHFYFTFIGACDMLFYGRASLEHAFGFKELQPATRDAYAEFVAEAALRILRPK